MTLAVKLGPIGRKISGSFLVLSLGVLCSLGALSETPLDVIPWSPASDIKTHTEFVAAAAEAQGEGQWLLREIPRVAMIQDPVYIRYPLFQFYSVLPYAVGGLLVNAGSDPYRAMLGVVLLGFVAGFAGVYYLARRLGLGWDAGLAAAIVFTLAPYHLTDWYGRFAFPELASFGLMPLALCGAFKALDEDSLGPLLGSSLAWIGLILSHNIFHIFGVLFIAAATLWRALAMRQSGFYRLWRPAAAYALAAACCAWFLAPVAVLGPHFLMAQTLTYPFAYRRLAPLSILLSPGMTATADVLASSPKLGLQVGWVILAAALASLVPGGPRWRERAGIREVSLALFFAALFLVWSPMDVWSILGQLKIVQFPYRLLVFTTLFGALLAAEVWDRVLWPTARPWARAAALVGLLGVAAWLARPYAVVERTGWPVAIAEKFYHELGANLRTAYRYQFSVTSTAAVAVATEDVGLMIGHFEGTRGWDGLMFDHAVVPENKVRLLKGRVTEVDLKGVKQEAMVLLPSPWYPQLYDLRVNGSPHPYVRSGDRLATRIPAGDVKLQYRFAGLPWANHISALAGLALLALALIWARQALVRLLN